MSRAHAPFAARVLRRPLSAGERARLVAALAAVLPAERAGLPALDALDHAAFFALVHLDGREITATLRMATDVVVVGSGPAGASAARRLAASGMRVTSLSHEVKSTHRDQSSVEVSA